MLTGESKPVAKREGDIVIGGAINGEGAITIEVKHTGAESFLSGVIRLVQEAQASKCRTQDIANRAAFWLTVIALSVSALTVFSWLAFTDQSLAFAIERAVTVLVISCPHALGLAVPLVVAVSTSIPSSWMGVPSRLVRLSNTQRWRSSATSPISSRASGRTIRSDIAAANPSCQN